MSSRKNNRQRRPMPPTTLVAEPTTEAAETVEDTTPDEIRFPIDGHTAGDRAYYAAVRKGDKWAVIDSQCRNPLGVPDFWDGRLWAPMTEKYQHLAYRFTQAEAEEFAKAEAAFASDVHQRYASMVRPEFADWLAGKTERLVAAVREQVAS